MSFNFVKLFLLYSFTLSGSGTSHIRKALELLKINLNKNNEGLEGLIEVLYYRGSGERMQRFSLYGQILP